MTSGLPEKHERIHRISHSLFHGRDPGPLLGPWLACGIVAIAAYIFERMMPAFHDVIGPFYWLLLIIVGVATWKWARARAKGRGAERRHGDRRQSDRKRKAAAGDAET
jgi:hypothetical protein